MRPDADFWRGRNVLVTGHTGFKGSWLTLWLHRMGARVGGIALPPPSDRPSLFEQARVDELCTTTVCDIRDETALVAHIRAAEPEIVFHLAAQPLVRASYRQPAETFAVNVMGTAHLLEGLRDLGSVRAAVVVTTDKVYRNREWAYPYREDDALGGHDPYSASKAAAELVVASYRDAFLSHQGVAVATARAGNVIGGGDWAEDRLIPDVVRQWQAGEPVTLRHPQAVRPWQHVLDPLAGYLRLAERLCQAPQIAGAYNFGPATSETVTVGALVQLARTHYGDGVVAFQPGESAVHEAGLLALETARTKAVLEIQPRWALPDAVARTMAWYRAQAAGADARALCDADITAFETGE